MRGGPSHGTLEFCTLKFEKISITKNTSALQLRKQTQLYQSVTIRHLRVESSYLDGWWISSEGSPRPW